MPLTEAPLVTPPKAPPAAPADGCPICHSPKWRSRKELKLYGVRVCKKCYYRLANRRQLAFVIDLVALNIVELIVGILVGVLIGVFGSSASLVVPAGFDLAMLGLAVLFILAFAFKDGFGGHSPGKALMGVQVVNADTLEPIGFAVSFKRNLPILLFQGITLGFVLISVAASMVANLPVLVFYLIIAYQLSRGPRWGDRFAGTKVIWKRYRHRVPFDTRGIFCQGCGYNLTGNVSGVCPECGTATPKRHEADTPEQAPQGNNQP